MRCLKRSPNTVDRCYGQSLWTSNGPEGRATFALAVDPSTPDTLYAATNGAAFKSADGGGSWQAINAGPSNVYAFVIDPTNPRTLYAGTFRGGAFKSTDGGGNWQAINAGLSCSYVTTQYGGLDGFVSALRTRSPAEATTASVNFRQGSAFAFNLRGAGLAAPGQTMWFPACVSVAGCSGTNGESVSFFRKGAGNLFTVSLQAHGKTFAPLLSSGPVAVTLSVGRTDDVDQANCRTCGRGKSASYS